MLLGVLGQLVLPVIANSVTHYEDEPTGDHRKKDKYFIARLLKIILTKTMRTATLPLFGKTIKSLILSILNTYLLYIIKEWWFDSMHFIYNVIVMFYLQDARNVDLDHNYVSLYNTPFGQFIIYNIFLLRSNENKVCCINFF